MGRKRKKEGREGFISIPTSIFQDRLLSVLEAIAEYLKEKKGMRYSEIAKLLNRDARTIWTVYSRVKNKRKDKTSKSVSKDFISVPTLIFQDRELSVLEVLAEYLKEKKGMRYSEIAKLLNRDDRTIWTAYQRAKAKRKR